MTPEKQDAHSIAYWLCLLLSLILLAPVWFCLYVMYITIFDIPSYEGLSLGIGTLFTMLIAPIPVALCIAAAQYVKRRSYASQYWTILLMDIITAFNVLVIGCGIITIVIGLFIRN